MVKHVVMWRYEDKKSIEIARRQLESMRGLVPALLSIETGVNYLDGPANYDLVLITEHKNREALQAYQTDPLHKKVGEVLSTLKSERVAVDFEF